VNAEHDGEPGGRPPRDVRVLHVIDSLGRAGAEQSLVATAPHLLDSGIDLHVAYLVERDGLRQELEATGVPVHSLADGRGRASLIRRTADEVARVRPDVVHTTLFEADLAGRLAAFRRRVPCISSLVNVAYGRTESAGLPRARLRAAQAADAATGRLVTHWHALTRHVAQVMSRRLLIPPHRIEVIPRGRDARALGRRTAQRRAAVRTRLGVDPDTPLVLAVGRQERQKGLDLLLEAVPELARRHPDLRVLVAGRQGGASAELDGRRKQLSVADVVQFLGVRDDVPDLMAAADVLAFPSRWEGAGGTVLEAMALGCPLVVTDHPVLREALDGRSALLVPAESPEALGTAILSTLDDPDAAAARAEVARHRFLADFTVEVSAARTAEMYRRVAAAGR
jgi:glycosyltransferase involved in cell wall biosynthesis